MKQIWEKKILNIFVITAIIIMASFTCYAAESGVDDEAVSEEQVLESTSEEQGVLASTVEDKVVELLIEASAIDEEELSDEEAKAKVEEFIGAMVQIVTSSVQSDVDSVVSARADVQEYDLEGAITAKLEETKLETIEAIDTETIDTCLTLSCLSREDFDMERLYELVYADNVTYETVLAEFTGTWSEGKTIGGLTVGGTEKGINKFVRSIEALINGTTTITAYNELDYEESEYGKLRAELSSATEDLKEEIVELYSSFSVVAEFTGFDEWIQSLEIGEKISSSISE